MSKKTLVIGASLKPMRYSNMAINKLVLYKHNVVAIGLRKGTVAGVTILTAKDTDALYDLPISEVHTVTLYLNALRQAKYYDFIISLHPKRVIFNPGTENEHFYTLLTANNIAFEVSCTLVLLSTNQY